MRYSRYLRYKLRACLRYPTATSTTASRQIPATSRPVSRPSPESLVLDAGGLGGGPTVGSASTLEACTDWAGRECRKLAPFFGVDVELLAFSCPNACADATPYCRPSDFDPPPTPLSSPRVGGAGEGQMRLGSMGAAGVVSEGGEAGGAGGDAAPQWHFAAMPHLKTLTTSPYGNQVWQAFGRPLALLPQPSVVSKGR